MNNSGIPDKTARWLAYVASFITGFIVLAMSESKSTEIKTHAWQSIWFGLAIVALNIVLGLFGWVPALGSFFLMLRSFTFTLWFVLTLVCIISAIDGKFFKIPGIYALAEKSAGN